jgi:hypothetical protein
VLLSAIKHAELENAVHKEILTFLILTWKTASLKSQCKSQATTVDAVPEKSLHRNHCDAISLPLCCRVQSTPSTFPCSHCLRNWPCNLYNLHHRRHNSSQVSNALVQVHNHEQVLYDLLGITLRVNAWYSGSISTKITFLISLYKIFSNDSNGYACYFLKFWIILVQSLTNFHKFVWNLVFM